jgi:hypothetical protein
MQDGTFAPDPAATATIENLPFEILIGLSEYIEPKDLLIGLSSTNRYFHTLFADESYWEGRLLRASRGYHAAILGTMSDAISYYFAPLIYRLIA